MGSRVVTTSGVSTANAAVDRAAWAEACDLFVGADRTDTLSGDDLERWATAAYLAGRDEESTDAWSRAFDARLAEGDAERAVLCAFWLAFGLFQRGELAQGGGWIASAQRLIGERDLDCVGGGYLAVPAGLMSLDGDDPHQALEHFERAASVAERFADADLKAMSLLGIGQALWFAGQAAKGAQCFDEVMVAVTRGEVSSVAAGIVYCAVVDGCQRAFDVRRAHEWTSALSRWCALQPELVSYRGQCLVHRSQVLQLHGDWSAATAEALAAAHRLSDPPSPAIGMAHYQLGELERLRGDFADAHASYERAQEHGRSPQPGYALLRLVEGDLATAAAAIDTAVAGASDTVALVQSLPAYVEIMIASGHVDRAREGVDRLRPLADGADSLFLDALATHAEGSVLLAEGNPRAALSRLRAACDLWHRLETPFQQGQTHVALALASRALGDDLTARSECEAARRTFGQIGAAVALRQIDELFEPSTIDTADPGLTSREVQVVRRVSAGLKNNEIADELFISVKTVERHLSNIFVKLDAPNRAAAAVIATNVGLL